MMSSSKPRQLLTIRLAALSDPESEDALDFLHQSFLNCDSDIKNEVIKCLLMMNSKAANHLGMSCWAMRASRDKAFLENMDMPKLVRRICERVSKGTLDAKSSATFLKKIEYPLVYRTALESIDWSSSEDFIKEFYNLFDSNFIERFIQEEDALEDKAIAKSIRSVMQLLGIRPKFEDSGEDSEFEIYDADDLPPIEDYEDLPPETLEYDEQELNSDEFAPTQSEKCKSETGLNIYRTEELIVAEGDLGKSCFIIQKGRVRITKSDNNGHQVVLAYLGQSQIFGEMSIIDHTPRSATVTAVEETHIIEVDENNFETVFMANPGFSMKMLKILVERLRNSSETIQHLEAKVKKLLDER